MQHRKPQPQHSHGQAPAPILNPILAAMRRACLGLALATPLALPAAALAQQAPQQAAKRHYDIPAGPLGTTLSRFAGAAGVVLSFDASLTAGKESRGLQGSYGVEEGFARLLSGSGLEAAHQGSGSYLLRPAPRAQGDSVLQPVTVTARSDSHQRDALTGYTVRRTTTGSKTEAELAEIPQAIHVITRRQMDDQGVQSLDEALRYTPGVVTGVYGGATYSDFVYQRGFSSPQYLDGTRMPYGLRGYAQLRLEPYGLERAEVLKGPASVLYGQSAPGGIVNSVRKKPSPEPVRELQLQAGSFERRQAAFDLGGQFDGSDNLSYRLTGLWRDAGTQAEHTSDDRRFIAPALSWADADSRITLLAHYQEDTAAYSPLPAYGTLLPNANGKLSTSAFLGYPDFDRHQRRQFSVGYDAEHRFDDTWSIQQTVNYSKVDMDFRYSYLSNLRPDRRTMNRAIWNSRDEADALTVDTRLVSSFATGALAHTLLFGVDYSRLGYDSYWGGSGTGTVDIFNPGYVRTTPDPALAPDQSGTQKQLGLYIHDQIKTGRWVLSIGARRDRARSDHLNSNTRVATDQSDSATTGRAGVVYLFDNGFAPYAGYSTSFEPTAGSDAQGSAFKPTEGRQYEAGLRYQPPASRISATLSAFHLTQQNVLTQDPNPPAGNPWAQVQTGEVEVRGVELEAKANLAAGFDLSASYARTDSEVTRTNTASQLGKEFQRTPKHQAALWANYGFSAGPLTGLSAGVGVRYFGDFHGDLANAIALPSYTLTDAALRYDLGHLSATLRGASINIHATNLFDKTYVASCFSLSSANCYYGNRRAVNATLQYRW